MNPDASNTTATATPNEAELQARYVSEEGLVYASLVAYFLGRDPDESDRGNIEVDRQKRNGAPQAFRQAWRKHYDRTIEFYRGRPSHRERVDGEAHHLAAQWAYKDAIAETGIVYPKPPVYNADPDALRALAAELAKGKPNGIVQVQQGPLRDDSLVRIIDLQKQASEAERQCAEELRRKIAAAGQARYDDQFDAIAYSYFKPRR